MRERAPIPPSSRSPRGRELNAADKFTVTRGRFDVLFLPELTTGRTAAALPGVVRFRTQLMALVLLAFWLAATHHCGLEATGLFAPEAAQTAEADCCSGSNCVTDACDLIESGAFQPASAPLKLLPPARALVAVLAVVAAPSIDTLASTPPPRPEVRRTPDWVANWCFVQRAALPSRAPSVVVG